MIYLDYSATTPVDKDILDEYVKTTLLFMGNVNSPHMLGKISKQKLGLDISAICRTFNCSSEELIFTSGASESNATAIRGILGAYNSKGKHIIISKLEHQSILKEAQRLSKFGYQIDYVNILKNGQVDLSNLESLIRKDTILISICAVNSEVGYKQDLHKIKQIINKKNSNVIFHSDLTQALGKTKIDLSDVDLASFSSHKIYAPKGCGILYKKKNIKLEPLIYPTNNIFKFRGGTPNLPLISAFSKAIIKYNNNIDNENKCKVLNKLLVNKLSQYNIHINSNDLCVPQIVNFSLLNSNSLDFIQYLDKNKIYISTSTACCSNEQSVILNELYNEEISKTSLRVSISHLTTEKQINEFIKIFDEYYKTYMQ